ncbi:MAG: DNA-binding GntR family transcriptional regulator [Gammaproteobacteria bacterium]|jgi:DNA-binding GntR family transcriptional regulator
MGITFLEIEVKSSDITLLEPAKGLRIRVYEALKDIIGQMDIYSNEEGPRRLDERTLGELLGVSRTPIREAISRLEQEGLVQNIARRGTFVVRKTKEEIMDMIDVWAALESMAARLAASRASDEEIALLRKMYTTYESTEKTRAHIDEYSETNVEFHQMIIKLGKSPLITQMSHQLFFHMRAIRESTIDDRDRLSRSVIDHIKIIEAIEDRDPLLAEQLVRDHALDLAKHVEEFVDYLE